LIFDSLRSRGGWLAAEHDPFMAPFAGALQKSLLHGYLAVFLGRERRFFSPLLRDTYVPHRQAQERLSLPLLCSSFLDLFTAPCSSRRRLFFCRFIEGFHSMPARSGEQR
jgi:hypothetical protein